MKKIYFLVGVLSAAVVILLGLLLFRDSTPRTDSDVVYDEDFTPQFNVDFDIEEEEAESFIMSPGITYVTTRENEKGNFLGLPGRELFTVKLTAYKDGSFSGKCIVTAINEYRDNEETSVTYNMNGTWSETSRHDKRVMEIVIDDLGNLSYIFPPSIFVDEDLNAYWDNMNGTPVKLLTETEYNTLLAEKKNQEANDREHHAIDLGLSVKWSDKNLGATANTDKGKCYAWGSLRGQRYDWTSWELPEDVYYKTISSNRTVGSNLYGTTADPIGALVAGNSRHGEPLPAIVDAASKELGYGWRMPTMAETQELIDNCDFEFQKKGTIVRSRINGNSIYLPNFEEEEGTKLTGYGNLGRYWTSQSVSNNPAQASCLTVSSSMNKILYGPRVSLLFIRPVYGDSEARNNEE